MYKLYYVSTYWRKRGDIVVNRYGTLKSLRQFLRRNQHIKEYLITDTVNGKEVPIKPMQIGSYITYDEVLALQKSFEELIKKFM